MKELPRQLRDENCKDISKIKIYLSSLAKISVTIPESRRYDFGYCL
jgi:hypothetical protein